MRSGCSVFCLEAGPIMPRKVEPSRGLTFACKQLPVSQGSNPEDASLRNAVDFLIETKVSSFALSPTFYHQQYRFRTGMRLPLSLLRAGLGPLTHGATGRGRTLLAYTKVSSTFADARCLLLHLVLIPDLRFDSCRLCRCLVAAQLMKLLRD